MDYPQYANQVQIGPTNELAGVGTAELGYSQAPVVVNNADDQDHWSGLRRDKLVQAHMNHTATITGATA
ncbi:hypothetical protein [Arthrobacter nitrophenolicus]